jgi:hypothetical protein
MFSTKSPLGDLGVKHNTNDRRTKQFNDTKHSGVSELNF